MSKFGISLVADRSKATVKRNSVKAKLAAGQPSVGSWLTLGSPLAAEYMAHVGWDWLVVDTEHSPIGFESTVNCFRAINTTDTIPMVRVAWNDPALIKRVLDGGALGVVVPLVSSVAEAEKAVAAVRYPPEGMRGVAGGRAMVYGSDYMLRANEEILCIVQLEQAHAVQASEDILSVEGVDVGFVGPMDLAASLGIPPGQHAGHPKSEEAIQWIVTKAEKVGKPLGVYASSPEEVNRRVEQGFQFVALSNDRVFMLAQARQELSRLSVPGWQPRSNL
jgi:4-hydroxy-2-oxoheptanedioate aldolase